MTGGKLGSALYSAEIFCNADRHGSGNVRAVLYQLVYDIRLLSGGNRFSQVSIPRYDDEHQLSYAGAI